MLWGRWWGVFWRREGFEPGSPRGKKKLVRGKSSPQRPRKSPAWATVRATRARPTRYLWRRNSPPARSTEYWRHRWPPSSHRLDAPITNSLARRQDEGVNRRRGVAADSLCGQYFK